MNDELKASLSHLERILTDAGAAIVPTLRPGLDAGVVESRLGELDLIPTAELVTWFNWHDGSGARNVRREVVEIVPDGEFYDLEYMCREYETARRVARELAAQPQFPWTAEAHWPAAWFPLLWLFGKGDLVVNLDAASREVSPVHVIWHDAAPEERARVRWPSVHAFVQAMIRRFETGVYWVDEDGIVQTESTNIDDPD